MGIVSVGLVLVCLVMVRGAEVPEFLHICHRKDPNFTECVKESVEHLRPILKSGMPDHNIPCVEPLLIKDLIKEEAGGLKITTDEVVAHGGGDFVVTDFTIDFDNMNGEFVVVIPEMMIDAKYTIDGKLVMIPVKGSGDFHANITDCVAKETLTFELYEENGEEHFKISTMKMKIKVGGGRLYLDGLFGDKNINDMVNETINRNFQAFVKELMPFVERGLAEKFKEIGNSVMMPYTYAQLMPE